MDIAFKDYTETREGLPLPCVMYPGHYGTFFGFKERGSSKNIYLCSCAYNAIEVHIQYSQNNPSKDSGLEHLNYSINGHTFPRSLYDKLTEDGIPDNQSIIKQLSFLDKLCHQCNRATPSFLYCHPMYGSRFIQSYGWYVNKKYLEFGIDRKVGQWNIIDRELCPEEILTIYDNYDYFHLKQKVSFLREKGDGSQANELHKKVHKIQQKITKIVENEVRLEFGHKKVGESWTTETILYYIVKSLLPNHEILHHYRPKFLEGQELDIYIKEMNIGLEYQGIQHFKPIQHWGGKKALRMNKKRDKRKKYLCEENGVQLLYFYYYEIINDKLVKDRLGL